jgi:alkanesulfonate monooxygenase SsuD/methylene tetrahydromethanopterin reductase-like flavin-dependent oxidoreductase (luciferase family)
MGRGLRFGICTDQNLPFATLAERWRTFEQLGFDSVWDCDHFNQPSRPTGPYFEGWTLLGALAARTDRIRVGILVSSNTFRHPALVAQQAVTVDHVSSGRLELGLGAGWYVPEHERFGIPFPAPGELVGRFHEAVQVIDSLLRNETTTFEGRYYRLEAAYVRPGPVQRPRPPLTLGAHRPRMLGICARYADSWNSHGTVEEIAERNRILDEHCAAIGRDPGEVRRSLYCWSSQMASQGLPDMWESVAAFEEVVGRYLEVGIDEFLIDQPRPEQFPLLERAATEVIPRLRREAAR